MDIAAWLRELGLERYEPAFRENEIDAEVLPDLTESDLSALGLPIGPRRKLLKAIAALREGNEPSSPAEQPSAVPAPVSATAAEAERRQPGLGHLRHSPRRHRPAAERRKRAADQTTNSRRYRGAGRGPGKEAPDG